MAPRNPIFCPQMNKHGVNNGRCARIWRRRRWSPLLLIGSQLTSEIGGVNGCRSGDLKFEFFAKTATQVISSQ